MQLEEFKKKMSASIENLSKEFGTLSTGRANINLLDGIHVDNYGAKSPLNQVSNINVVDAKTLHIQVWDRSNVKPVEMAIINSGFGLNPTVEGQSIRIVIPELSEERRKDVCKVASKYTENCKIAIRNIRKDAMDAVKKAEKSKELSEDIAKKTSEQIQKMTDEFVKKSDDLFTAKEKEIMKI